MRETTFHNYAPAPTPKHAPLTQVDVIRLIAKETGCSFVEAKRTLLRAANPQYKCKIVEDNQEHNAVLSFCTGDAYSVVATEIV